MLCGITWLMFAGAGGGSLYEVSDAVSAKIR
jgi:hypothetical protein